MINTLVAYLLYTHALQRLQAVEANIMLNLTPVGTAFIAWIVLGERLHPVQIAAMLLMVAGTTLVQWRRRSVLTECWREDPEAQPRTRVHRAWGTTG